VTDTPTNVYGQRASKRITLYYQFMESALDMLKRSDQEKVVALLAGVVTNDGRFRDVRVTFEWNDLPEDRT
jgi:hypothetical protein